ncbi:MAG: FecR domain-containing protein [Treponema sp.]|jgi:hypothetical protein|nr:FecR domain-containing protein [Treponema sp.]
MQGNRNGGRAALAAAFLLAARGGLFAQDAQIYHGEGAEFVISNGGKLENVPIAPDAPLLKSLSQGNAVQTGPGTWIEIQLTPSGTIIKLAENSSLTYNGFDEQGRFLDVNLLYGRIRAVFGEQGDPASRTLVIRAGIAAVRMEGGDVGLDYLVAPPYPGTQTPRSLLRAYGFRGQNMVYPFDPAGKIINEQGIHLNAQESLYMEAASSLVFSERRTMSEEAHGYWSDHQFTGTAPLPMPDITLAPLLNPDSLPPPESIVQAPPASPVLPDLAPYFRARRIKNTAVAFGILLSVAGGLCYGLADQMADGNAENANTIRSISYAPMGVGLFSLFTGLFYNPKKF